MRKWSYRKSLWLYLGLTILPGCCYASYFGGLFADYIGIALVIAGGPYIALALLLAWVGGRNRSIEHIRWYVVGGTLSLLIVLVALAEASVPIAARQTSSSEGPYYVRALMFWCTSAFLGWFVLLIYPALRQATCASSRS